MIKKKEMGLYVHVPFCVKKCDYCDFLSKASDADEMTAYVEAVVNEMLLYKKDFGNTIIKTIFIGGGTPSILEPYTMEKLLKGIKKSFNLKALEEFTIECNPGTLNIKKIKLYKKHGVNRISLGLQSADNIELKKLGRIHTFEEFLETYSLLREENINNINIDLMSGLPGQDLKNWEKTLYSVLTLAPEHISAYSLIIEEGTPFFSELDRNELPDEDEEREMYYLTCEILKKYGYDRYEISNYSKSGKECRHNISYWGRKDYLGIGLGAASFIDGVRYKNTRDIEKYIKEKGNPLKIKVDINKLSFKEEMEEFMFLGLRMMKGISVDEFKENFGSSIEEIYGTEIEKLINKGLMENKDGKLILTEKGIDLSNDVMSDFIQD